jgi:proteasome lid subunit RPN8/RPN11
MSSSTWTVREGSPLGGSEIRRWRERSVPGQPGVVRREFLDAGNPEFRIDRYNFAEPVRLVQNTPSAAVRSTSTDNWRDLLWVTGSARTAPTRTPRSGRKVTPVKQRTLGTLPPPPRVVMSAEVAEFLNHELAHDTEERATFILGNVSNTQIYLESPHHIMRGDWDRLHIDNEVREHAIGLARNRRVNVAALAHTHPTGPIGLSDADLDVARVTAHEFGHRFAMLVVGPHKLGAESWDYNPWIGPTIRCWVSDADDIDRADVVETELRTVWP